MLCSKLKCDCLTTLVVIYCYCLFVGIVQIDINIDKRNFLLKYLGFCFLNFSGCNKGCRRKLIRFYTSMSESFCLGRLWRCYKLLLLRRLSIKTLYNTSEFLCSNIWLSFNWFWWYTLSLGQRLKFLLF